MKKIISLLIFSIIVFINGCATLSASLEQAKKENTGKINSIPNGYKIAVFSLIGNQMQINKYGITIADSFVKQIDVSAWNMDAFIADTITAAISPKFIITKIIDSGNTIYVFRKDVIHNVDYRGALIDSYDVSRSFADENESLISDLAGTGIDAILVVAPKFARLGDYKVPIYNYGLIRDTIYVWYFTQIYCAFDLVLVDTKTRQTIVRTALPAVADNIDNSYWIKDSENLPKETLDPLQPIVKNYIKKQIETHLQSMAILNTDKQEKRVSLGIPMKSAAYSDGSRPGIPMKSATP